MEEQYTGIVYKDTKVDLLCDLTEERMNVYDRRINTVADIIITFSTGNGFFLMNVVIVPSFTSTFAFSKSRIFV